MNWSLSFKEKELGSKTYNIFHSNGIKIGELLQSEDGYYNFWPESYNGGYWPGYILAEIARACDILNAPWDFHIEHNL
jgi:hypothetical protein